MVLWVWVLLADLLLSLLLSYVLVGQGSSATKVRFCSIFHFVFHSLHWSDLVELCAAKVHLQYVWLLHVFVGLSGFLWMAWLGLVLQLLFLYYGRLGGNVYSLLVLFRFDWDCFRLHIMGYGRVKLRFLAGWQHASDFLEQF